MPFAELNVLKTHVYFFKPQQFDFVRTIISAADCAADFWYNTRIVRADDSMRTIHMSTFKAAAAPSASGRRSDHPRPTTQAPAIHRSRHSRSNQRRGKVGS